MEHSILLALCEGNLSFTDGFPSQPVGIIWSFDFFFFDNLNKLLNKLSVCRLRRCNDAHLTSLLWEEWDVDLLSDIGYMPIDILQRGRTGSISTSIGHIMARLQRFYFITSISFPGHCHSRRQILIYAVLNMF